MITSHARRALLLVVAISVLATSGQAAAVPSGIRVHRVDVAQLVAAMESETGYDPVRTTNSGRFQGRVYVRLAEDIAAQDAADTVLFIDHGDWYQAFREITGVSVDEVPDFVRLAYEARQDVFIDPRPGRVVVRVREGAAPRLAANVRLSWRGDLSSADSYAFKDLESTPTVLIHSDRVVSFRLLDFGDRLVFDQVDGSRVRPLDGALGTLFRVIGLAAVKQVRMAVATDGTALARATVRKAFMKVSATVTVGPDGTADRGVPDGRADLEVLEAELRQDFELEYAPTEWVEVVAAAYETAAASLRLTAAGRR